jgi:hypothetical protein
MSIDIHIGTGLILIKPWNYYPGFTGNTQWVRMLYFGSYILDPVLCTVFFRVLSGTKEAQLYE